MAIASSTSSTPMAIRGERAIVEEQAEIVRRIFRGYAGGRSPKEIAFRSDREGIPATTSIAALREEQAMAEWRNNLVQTTSTFLVRDAADSDTAER